MTAELLEQRVATLEREMASLKQRLDDGRVENPWLKAEGVYENDPLFDAWQEAIAEYRREKDAGRTGP